jgi:soluble cytochrome b562
MNLRFVRSCCLATTLALGPVLRAQDAMAPAPAAMPAAAPDKEVKTELDTKMGRMSRALRALKKQASDATMNESSLKLVASIVAGTKASMDLTPAKAADLPEDQKAKFIADYKAGLQGMLDELSLLEGAFKAGDNAGAVKLIADIEALEKKDHKQFRKPKAN